jgi:hypothetical protein
VESLEGDCYYGPDMVRPAWTLMSLCNCSRRTDNRRVPRGCRRISRGMRLLAWNIRQGGGSRLDRIADALAHRDADILALSEYRGGGSAARLLAALDGLGYRYVTKLAPPSRSNGVLIAARCPFREHGSVGSGLPEPYRMVSVEFPSFRLSGVYMPNLLAKIPYWEALIAAISPERNGHALAIGDFNTCRPFIDEVGAIDAPAYYMDMIEEIGLRLVASPSSGGP